MLSPRVSAIEVVYFCPIAHLLYLKNNLLKLVTSASFRACFTNAH